MGFPQNNDFGGRIIGDSDRCQNSILDHLRDVKNFSVRGNNLLTNLIRHTTVNTGLLEC